MKLVVLGSGTSVFHPQRASAGFWLETVSARLLLDCSADAPHRMAEENLDWRNLDAIWISHLHLDHCAGLAPFLFGMRTATKIEPRTKPMKIFGCEGLEQLLKTLDESHDYKLFEQTFAIEFHEFLATDDVQPIEILPGVHTAVISAPHRPESLALRLNDSAGATLVYTSDTGFSARLAEFARGVDLLILECSFYRNKPVQTHLELADAMRMAQLAGPRKLLLTHLYPEWDGVDLEAEAKKVWNGDTVAAFDGLRLTI